MTSEEMSRCSNLSFPLPPRPCGVFVLNPPMTLLCLPVTVVGPAKGTHAALPALGEELSPGIRLLGAVSMVMAQGTWMFSDPDSGGNLTLGINPASPPACLGPQGASCTCVLFKEESEP